ncbi:MAG: hypothetical protein JWQ06_1425, partial [Mucilaginibacter sp.]|nr:hypothetical protein [Mucilaginibacter sp.]
MTKHLINLLVKITAIRLILIIRHLN